MLTKLGLTWLICLLNATFKLCPSKICLKQGSCWNHAKLLKIPCKHFNIPSDSEFIRQDVNKNKTEKNCSPIFVKKGLQYYKIAAMASKASMISMAPIYSW